MRKIVCGLATGDLSRIRGARVSQILFLTCSTPGGTLHSMTANPPTNLPSHLKRVVIDNGGHTCKVGFAGQSDPERCLLNGVVKTKGPTGKVYVGDQYEACPDYSSLQYRLSLERGCLVNWDTQAEVWSRALGADVRGSPSCRPLVAGSPHSPPACVRCSPSTRPTARCC